MTGTYGDLSNQIIDELDATETSSTAVVQQAIQDAITFYERERFWFNESNSSTFATVAGQDFYSSSDLALIPYIVEFDELRITIGTNRFGLTFRTYADIEDMSISSTNRGQPTDFGYYGQRIRLYPIPDAVYTIRFVGIVQLAVLSLAADTNAWMVQGKDLIRARAKWDYWLHSQMEPDLAAGQKQAEEEALASLRQSTARRISTSHITPSW